MPLSASKDTVDGFVLLMIFFNFFLIFLIILFYSILLYFTLLYTLAPSPSFL